jgi:predicted DNA-binding transcriptional regulator YafY
MELLSYGANLQVIQPKSLIDKMTGVVKDMYKIYSIEKNKT